MRIPHSAHSLLLFPHDGKNVEALHPWLAFSKLIFLEDLKLHQNFAQTKKSLVGLGQPCLFLLPWQTKVLDPLIWNVGDFMLTWEVAPSIWIWDLGNVSKYRGKEEKSLPCCSYNPQYASQGENHK